MAQLFGNRWEVIRQLGEGGQSHVFEVRDKLAPAASSRTLKRLKNLKRLDRFKRELEAITALSHLNVVAVVDYNLEDSKPYIVMEYCQAGSLEESIEHWANEPIIALKLFREICEGVAAAHEAGIVHRDLKPANILLRSPAGPAVVSDFGICHVDDGIRFTVTEEAVGPRIYMAPEFEDGKAEQVTKSADVYSLGKVLYGLLSGGKVFARERHRDDAFNLIKLRSSSSMEHVNRLLDRMIIGTPNDRLQSAGDVLNELARVTHLVAHDYQAVNPNISQRCRYCGEGNYLHRDGGGNATAVRNFGFTPVGNPDWRILVCDQCGHVDLFRVELAARKDWWKS